MGYTHYWTQTSDLPKDIWDETILPNLLRIASEVQQRQEVPLGNALGERGSKPSISGDGGTLQLNGWGDAAHETFSLGRVAAGWTCCKTASRPYDVAVTAMLCYLSTSLPDGLEGAFSVSSDGYGRDWLAGLEVAKNALPELGNQLDIPRDILENDRWCGPWIKEAFGRDARYRLLFCVDGKAYVMDNTTERSAYAFVSHYEAAKWASGHMEKEAKPRRSSWGGDVKSGGPLFDASGAFDAKRWDALAKQQDAAYAGILSSDQASQPIRKAQPPAFVRPGDVVTMAPAYSMAELLKSGPG